MAAHYTIGSVWTQEEILKLKKLAEDDTPTPAIAKALMRTEPAVRTKAAKEGISLKPIKRGRYG